MPRKTSEKLLQAQSEAEPLQLADEISEALPAELPIAAEEGDPAADDATTTEHEDAQADLAVLFAETVQEDSDSLVPAMPESDVTASASDVSVSVSDTSIVTAEAETSQVKTTKSKIVKVKTDKVVKPAESDIPPPKNARQLFYSLDFRALDRNLSPEQEQEWNAIYASFRSRSVLTGTVIGVDDHTFDVTDERGAVQRKTIRSLIIVSFRVKVMIPETEVWAVGEESPYYTLRGMVGAKVDYVVMNVDRENDCVIASRRIAMTKRRRHMLQIARNNRELVDCDTILVSRKAMLVNCGGFDLVLTQKDLCYTAVDDLRTMYKPGAQLRARLMDMIGNKPVISVKEVNPNPFDGADQRHPVGCRRQGIIEGKYAGGVFCRLPDNTTCLCLYSNNHYDGEFVSGDAVLVHITEFDYRRKLIHGRIVGKQ